jgi:error-prone DNA polymerase
LRADPRPLGGARGRQGAGTVGGCHDQAGQRQLGLGRDNSFAEIATSEGLDPTDRRLALALELAEDIQDLLRHLATHVGGFVMRRGPLIEMAVVTNAAMEGRTVLEWDKDDIDALGLLKVDILALGSRG